MDDVDLSLVTTEQMMNELLCRHEAAVFICTIHRTEEDSQTSVFAHGECMTVIGLCQYGASRLSAELMGYEG